MALDTAAARINAHRDARAPIADFVAKTHRNIQQAFSVPNAERRDLFAVFNASYEDLSPNDQRRFRALSVAPASGCTADHLAHIWGDAIDIAEQQIDGLLNLSLIKIIPGRSERFRLHDLQDEFGLALLNAAGEADAAHLAHAQWVIALFEAHFTDNLSSAPHVAEEFDNLRHAANWAEAAGEGAILARLATRPRNWLYNIFRNTHEWLTWLQHSLSYALPNTSSEPLHANTLQAIGDVQQFRKEIDAALKSYNAALDLFKAVGAKLGEANVKLAMAQMSQQRDQWSRLFSEAAAAYEAIGDAYSTGRAHFYHAIKLREAGDGHTEIRKRLVAARTAWQSILFERGIAAVDAELARLDTDGGDAITPSDQP